MVVAYRVKHFFELDDHKVLVRSLWKRLWLLCLSVVVCVLQCYNPQACLQMREDWNAKVRTACLDRAARQQG